MTVKKEDANTYLIVSADLMDWARIFLIEGERDQYHWGDISFISTFGNGGHHFCSISPEPFDLWLAGCDWPYLATKFWGNAAHQLDFDASTKELRRRICVKRRNGYLTERDAQDCWSEIGALQTVHDASGFCWQLRADCPGLMEHAGVYEESPCETRSNPQCDGFRDVIWNQFCAWIREQQAMQA